MLRSVAFALYGLAVTLATPAAAIDPALLTGAMQKMQLDAPWRPVVDTFAREDSTRGRLSDYAGDVVVLNFWATWCAPCREEMPSLQILQDRFEGDGLEVVTMAFGRHNPVQMKRFWQDAGITSLPLHLDAGTELARALGVRGLPHTVILNRQGEIVAQLIGETDWSAPETTALIRSFLAE